jgi:hypothetical protein
MCLSNPQTQTCYQLSVDVTSCRKDGLKLAFGLFEMRHSKVEGYKLCGDRGMVFYWHVGAEQIKEGISKLPFVMNLAQASEFAWNWLEQAKMPPEPSTDGSTSRGWRVYNERYERIGECDYAFVAVQPTWIIHGK